MESLISVLNNKQIKTASADNAYAVGSLFEDAAQLHARRKYLRTNYNPEQDATQQFKDSVDVNAPSSPWELATAGVMGAGVPYAASRIKIPFLGHNPTPKTLGQSVAFSFGPKMLPFNAGFEAMKYLATPFTDPRRENGQVGYLSSLGDTLSAAGENFGRKGEEVNQRYGKVIGLPIRVMHGILNPIAGGMYAGQQVKNMMFGKSGEALRLEAHNAISELICE